MPTFKTFKDTRDGKIYNCVLMPDGKWWAAENLAWEGAGVWPNLDEANSALGRMYSPSEVVVPEGTRLPLYADFVALIDSCGGQSVAGYKLLSSKTNDYGFSALLAGQILGGTNPSNFGAEAAFCGNWSAIGNGWSSMVIPSWMNNVFTSYGFSTNTKFSVRFIVEEFPVTFPFTQITSAGNFQLQTANRQFKSEAGSYHTLGSQGLPSLRCNINWDLATTAEETLFQEWFDPETSWDHDDFPGIGDVTLQAAGLPKYTRTVKGLSISLDVAIFPRALATLETYTGAVPVMTPYAGVEAGYTYVSEQAVVTTSGRVGLRQVAGERGESFEISWQTSLAGLMGFIAWFAYIKNGRKQFLGSMCGKTAWLWKIIGVPSYSLTGPDYARITMTVNGRDVRRALTVTIEKESL